MGRVGQPLRLEPFLGRKEAHAFPACAGISLELECRGDEALMSGHRSTGHHPDACVAHEADDGVAGI